MSQKGGETEKSDQFPEEKRSLLLNRCAHLVSIGGLELEEKLKDCSYGNPMYSFLWRSDPDHPVYKQKITEYTESPPPTDPTPSTLRVDLPDSRGRYMVVPPFTVSPYKFMIRIPEGMMRKELGVRKFTAQFVARYGNDFRDALWDRVCSEAQFQFLKKGEKGYGKHTIFTRLSIGYKQVIKSFVDKPRKSDTARMEAVVEGFFAALDAFKKKQGEDEEDEVMEKVLTDRRDFVVSDEYFVEIENKELPQRDKLTTLRPPMWMMMQYRERPDPCLDPNTFRVGIPGGGMMRKELGIIKLTAQFVARYGSDFQDSLWERVCTETEFQFLNGNPGSDRYTLFSQLHVAYGTVITPWACPPEAAVEGFLAALDAFKKKQEEEEDVVVEKLVTDRGDFVVSDEYFLGIEFSPPPETPPQQIFPMPHIGCHFATRPHMGCLFATRPMHAGSSASRPNPLVEEPESKRHKFFEESALVSEEEFLAQHPGSARIMVKATAARFFIVITVESLTENVGSLKEKIAEETGIPVKRQMLVGRTGVLKDDMSLAHYNLGVGEMLNLNL